MKISLEPFQPDANSSFRILTPHLSDLFYWHYHPEYELVFIDGVSGTRHVGNHLSTYEGSDLVMIGPNIPHLNFDYGVTTDYREVVVQIGDEFLNANLLSLPELADVSALFERARQGISFGQTTKQQVGATVLALNQHPPFAQLMVLLTLFQTLATTDDYTLLNARPIVSAPDLARQQRIRQLYQFVDEHYTRPITLDEAAEQTNLTKAAFCRYIKRMTQMTFTEFLNQYRISQAKRHLLLNQTVTEACFACGFDSLSYFNRVFRQLTGENPSQFRKRHVPH